MNPPGACDRAVLLGLDVAGDVPLAEMPNLTDSQRRRLESFGLLESVDIHCHCLPGLDDGPETMVEALELSRALVEDGTTTVLATPHQLGRYDGRNESGEIRRKVGEITAALKDEGIPLRILPGSDVRIDERIPSLIEQDRVMTVADSGQYLLLELPSDFCISPIPLMHALREKGVELILTHPERYVYLAKEPQKVIGWVQEGLHLQVTAGSLTGRFGELAMQAGWFWLEWGVVATVADDAHHATARRPCMSDAIAAITSRLGRRVASITCLENPLRAIKGLPIGRSGEGQYCAGLQ